MSALQELSCPGVQDNVEPHPAKIARGRVQPPSIVKLLDLVRHVYPQFLGRVRMSIMLVQRRIGNATTNELQVGPDNKVSTGRGEDDQPPHQREPRPSR
jgi:hypothetical protein